MSDGDMRKRSRMDFGASPEVELHEPKEKGLGTTRKGNEEMRHAELAESAHIICADSANSACLSAVDGTLWKGLWENS